MDRVRPTLTWSPSRFSTQSVLLWGVNTCRMICQYRELPPPAKFHHQKNSATSKNWLLVEQRQNQKNLPTDAKIGQMKEKGKAPRCGKNLPPTEFGTKTQNFKSVKMIINYAG
jgi:hypothetical protein